MQYRSVPVRNADHDTMYAWWVYSSENFNCIQCQPILNELLYLTIHLFLYLHKCLAWKLLKYQISVSILWDYSDKFFHYVHNMCNGCTINILDWTVCRVHMRILFQKLWVWKLCCRCKSFNWKTFLFRSIFFLALMYLWTTVSVKVCKFFDSKRDYFPISLNEISFLSQLSGMW